MGNIVSFKREFGLILVGGIILTASLLWKDAIVEIEEVFFPKTKGITNRILFTIIITIILIIVAIHLRSFFGLSKSPISEIGDLQRLGLSEDPNNYIENDDNKDNIKKKNNYLN